MSSETDNTFSISTIFVVVGIDLNTVLNLSCPQFCNNYIMDGELETGGLVPASLYRLEQVFSFKNREYFLYLEKSSSCGMS